MEGTELQKVENISSMPMITIQDVATQIQAVEQCIKILMKPKLHYGLIPGCGDKPTLLKPGAEMLAKLFQLRPEFKRETIDLGNGHIKIISSCTMYSRVTGKAVGEGAGSCSTMESKYRWRKAQRSCPSCGVDGSIGRSKFPPKNDPQGQPGWYCRDCKTQFAYDDPAIRNQQCGRIENPDIADQYNTVQKISDKRAYVAATITSVGASDFVTQDIEDFADALIVAPTETQAEVVATEPAKKESIKPEPQKKTGSGIEAGERIKKILEAREKPMTFEALKKELSTRLPGVALTKICAEHEDKIIEEINNGEFDLPF